MGWALYPAGCLASVIVLTQHRNKNKWIILGASVIILIFSAFGFKKIMDDNRKYANPDAVYCLDCGRYH